VARGGRADLALLTHFVSKGPAMTGVVLAGAAVASLLALNMTAPSARAQDPKPVVVIETSMGNITVELDPAKAPITVENFLKYVDAGFYNGTIFHRVIPGFMIQGGGMLPNMKEKDTNPPIKLEAGNGLSNKRGTIAMARTNDPNSATSQFFINHRDNDRLDTVGGGYAVFGKVTEGLDVVDKVAAVQTATRGGHLDVPVDAVTITSIKRKTP
jgi:peptidyl-prolyl cis-trans isomerase A (cyclophilin A)